MKVKKEKEKILISYIDFINQNFNLLKNNILINKKQRKISYYNIKFKYYNNYNEYITIHINYNFWLFISNININIYNMDTRYKFEYNNNIKTKIIKPLHKKIVKERKGRKKEERKKIEYNNKIKLYNELNVDYNQLNRNVSDKQIRKLKINNLLKKNE